MEEKRNLVSITNEYGKVFNWLLTPNQINLLVRLTDKDLLKTGMTIDYETEVETI